MLAVPPGPDDLVLDMAEFLMEVGVGGSFLEASRLRRSEAGAGAAGWSVVARGLLIPYSCEGKVFT